MIQLLIVDDEWTIREGLEKTIPWRDWGIQVAGTAKNGLEALQKLEEVDVNIVLTDIKMPGMNGLELAKVCKERYPTHKVIILTGHDEFEYAQKGIRIGVDDFLLKPTDFEELKSTMQKTVQLIKQTKRDAYKQIGLQVREYIATRDIHQLEALKQNALLTPSFVMIRSQQLLPEPAIPISSQGEEQLYLMGNIPNETYVEMYVKHLVDTDKPNTISISCVVGQIDKLVEIYHQVKVASEPWMRTDNVHVYRYRDEKYTLQFEQVIKEIHSRYKEQLTQTEFADRLHMSNSYFSRMFKQHTQMKFSEYILNIRIEAAKQLLERTVLKTYEIAEQVGIHDSRYFSTVFRKQTNMSPAEYRNRYR